MSKEKRRFGDRRDATLIRQQDGMHLIMPMIYPNRCDNEAFISERIDLTNIDKYLEKRNAENPEFKFTLFHLIVAAILKTIILRPKLNRFIANKNNYQRNSYSASFVVKKQFSDTSEEGLAFIYATEDSTLDSLHEDLFKQISREKKGGAGNATSNTMDILNKLPHWFVKFFIWLMRQLDRHGIVPKAIIEADPYYASVILSNLGSIKLRSGYHHLTNWGTCSLFCVIGEKKWTPLYDQNGLVAMRETVDLGFTVDERIADGYYYSKSIRLFKHLLAHPELLELPFEQEVDYD